MQSIKEVTQAVGHPTSVKRIELLKNAGVNDKELCEIIEEIAKECEVCLKYQKKKKKKKN